MRCIRVAKKHTNTDCKVVFVVLYRGQAFSTPLKGLPIFIISLLTVLIFMEEIKQ